MLLQYYADDTPQDDPEEFDANRAALGLRTRLRKVQSEPQPNSVIKRHEVGHLKHLAREHLATLHDLSSPLASQAVQHIMFVTHHMSLTAALHKEQNRCFVPLW